MKQFNIALKRCTNISFPENYAYCLCSFIVLLCACKIQKLTNAFVFYTHKVKITIFFIKACQKYTLKNNPCFFFT